MLGGVNIIFVVGGEVFVVLLEYVVFSVFNFWNGVLDYFLGILWFEILYNLKYLNKYYLLICVKLWFEFLIVYV